MDKTFICLANSYKHGNRCIAGVEINHRPEQHRFSVIRSYDNSPKWFRPVHRTTDGGAIPNEEALSINVLDIVVATNVVACPSGAQQENYYYESLRKIGYVKQTISNLDTLCDTTHSTIFGNKGAAVHPNQIASIDYSIMLIKTSDIEFYLKDRTEFGKGPQPKAKIKFKGATLDIPITDPEFRKFMNSDLEKANSYSSYYLAMSLGIENEGWYSKLVAGVIPMDIETGGNIEVKSTNTGKQGQVHNSLQKTLDLYNQGCCVSQIAARRGLAESTIYTHLVSLVELRIIDVHRLVSNTVIDRVSQYKRSHPNTTTLREYFDGLNEEISYNEIKLVLAYLKRD